MITLNLSTLLNRPAGAGGGGGGTVTQIQQILSRETTPLTVLSGATVYVVTDGGTEPLEAIIPAGNANIQPITFLPAGQYSVTPLNVLVNGQTVMGDTLGEDLFLTEDNIAFEMDWVNANFGWGVYARGAYYATTLNQTTINASDLVNFREVEDAIITLLPTDREAGVVSTSTGTTVGQVILPNSAGLDVGWQTSFFQGAERCFTFVTDELDTAPLVAFGGQYTTLGEGVLVSIVLGPGKRWFIGGGLTGV